MNRDTIITSIEDFYCSRMTELVDENKLDDSNAIFNEFIVDEKEPVEWLFLEDISDVLGKSVNKLLGYEWNRYFYWD